MDSQEPAIVRFVALFPHRVRKIFYRVPFLNNFSRSILNWLLRNKKLFTVTISNGFMKGIKLKCSNKDEKGYWLGTYEFKISETILREIVPGMIVYDLGAHYGYFTLLFARCTTFKGKVFSFEPLPDAFKRLNENIKLNCFHHIETFQLAVSEKSKRALMRLGISSTTAQLTDFNTDADSGMEVQVISLDDFVFRDGNPLPSLMKLDVEAFEGALLRGAQRVLQASHPKLIIEIHNAQSGKETWEVLKKYHYSVYSIERNREEIRGPGSLSGGTS